MSVNLRLARNSPRSVKQECTQTRKKGCKVENMKQPKGKQYPTSMAQRLAAPWYLTDVKTVLRRRNIGHARLHCSDNAVATGPS